MIAFRNDRERQTQARRCSTCQQPKHLAHFSGKCARCKICNREYTRWYRATNGGRESCQEYNAKLAARLILTDEDRAELKEAARKRYRASDLGKVTHHISVTRRKLRQQNPPSVKVQKTLARLLARQAKLRARQEQRK
jgi:phage FluMu protein Com